MQELMTAFRTPRLRPRSVSPQPFCQVRYTALLPGTALLRGTVHTHSPSARSRYGTQPFCQVQVRYTALLPGTALLLGTVHSPSARYGTQPFCQVRYTALLSVTVHGPSARNGTQPFCQVRYTSLLSGMVHCPSARHVTQDKPSYPTRQDKDIVILLGARYSTQVVPL